MAPVCSSRVRPESALIMISGSGSASRLATWAKPCGRPGLVVQGGAVVVVGVGADDDLEVAVAVEVGGDGGEVLGEADLGQGGDGVAQVIEDEPVHADLDVAVVVDYSYAGL
jgi:hypothetical protein